MLTYHFCPLSNPVNPKFQFVQYSGGYRLHRFAKCIQDCKDTTFSRITSNPTDFSYGYTFCHFAKKTYSEWRISNQPDTLPIFFEDVLGYHAVTVDNRKILTIQPAKNRKKFSGILTRKYP